MAPPTILAHKTDFLTAQTLQLSRALAPSSAWRASNNHHHNRRGGAATTGNPENEEDEPAPSAPPLPEKAVDDALYRLNQALLQHARRVYAPQATRHVAEQIEALYLEAGDRAVRWADADSDEEDEEDVAATDEAIASLPPTWDQHPSATAAAQAEAHPPEAQRYAEMATRLTELSDRRREAHERAARLRRMHTLLAPFRDGGSDSADGKKGGGENTTTNLEDATTTVTMHFDANGDEDGEGGAAKVVQPNLVTRDGELEKELERMRFLLVRVAGRVARLPDAGSGEEQGNKRSKKKRRLDRDARSEAEDGADEEEVGDDLEALERHRVERLLNGL